MSKRLILVMFAALILGSFPVAAEEVEEYAQDVQIPWNSVDILSYYNMPGDYLIVDVASNTGYLINDTNQTYSSFPVLTGQQRNVRYLGRSYFAATPEKNWVVKEEVIQPDRITFAESGRFLRLFANGEERTSYGIHGHKYFESMLASGNQYRSMGCVIVADDVLTVIENSFNLNNKSLAVITTIDMGMLPWS